MLSGLAAKGTLPLKGKFKVTVKESVAESYSLTLLGLTLPPTTALDPLAPFTMNAGENVKSVMGKVTSFVFRSHSRKELAELLGSRATISILPFAICAGTVVVPTK